MKDAPVSRTFVKFSICAFALRRHQEHWCGFALNLNLWPCFQPGEEERNLGISRLQGVVGWGGGEPVMLLTHFLFSPRPRGQANLYHSARFLLLHHGRHVPFKSRRAALPFPAPSPRPSHLGWEKTAGRAAREAGGAGSRRALQRSPRLAAVGSGSQWAGGGAWRGAVAKHPTWAGRGPRGAEPGCEEASGGGGASGPAGLGRREASG